MKQPTRELRQVRVDKAAQHQSQLQAALEDQAQTTQALLLRPVIRKEMFIKINCEIHLSLGPKLEQVSTIAICHVIGKVRMKSAVESE